MSHMDVFNDILNGGFTAPVLCDLANARDLANEEKAMQFVEFIKGFSVLRFQLPQEKDLNYNTRYFKLITPEAVAFQGFQCHLKATIGEISVTLCSNGNFTGMSSSVRTINDIVGLPHDVIADAVKGNEFDAPVVYSDDVRWEGKLTRRIGAAELRQSIQNAVKQMLTIGNSTGICDVFELRAGRAEKRLKSPERGSLTKGMHKALTRWFFKLNKSGDIDPNATASDLGFTNIDHYAVAVYHICYLHNVSVNRAQRYKTVGGNDLFEQCVRDFKAATGEYDVVLGNLDKFVEFLRNLK